MIVELTQLKVQYKKEVSERNIENQLLNKLARAQPSAVTYMPTEATARIATLEDELAAMKNDFKASVTTQGQAAIKMDEMKKHFRACTENKDEQLRVVCSLPSEIRLLSSIYPSRADAQGYQRSLA